MIVVKAQSAHMPRSFVFQEDGVWFYYNGMMDSFQDSSPTQLQAVIEKHDFEPMSLAVMSREGLRRLAGNGDNPPPAQ